MLLIGSKIFYAHALKSEHAQYCSVHMPIGLNGLGMPNEGCSMCMPIVITNSEVSGVNRTLSHI